MKKFTLFLMTMVLSMVCNLSSFAQEPAAPKFSPVATDGETVQYLYNVETHTFVTGGNDWNTRASASIEKGNPFKVSQNGSTYKLSDQVGNNWNALDCDGDANSWIDGQGRSGDGTWTITEIGDNTYEISNTVGSAKGYKWGVTLDLSNTRVFFKPTSAAYGTTWAFVSEEDYAEYMASLDKDAVEAYAQSNASVVKAALQAEIDAANKVALDARLALLEGTNIYDKQGYNNYYEEYITLKESFEAGELEDKIASPNDVTGWHASTAYNFLLTPWQINGEDCNEFAKSLYINTWSTEGISDGSNFLVPFFEYWTGDDNSLGANKITTTVKGLTPGKTYQVSAFARVRIKNNGGDTATGITLSAGDGEPVSVTDGDTFGQKNEFRVVNAVATGAADENGNLLITFDVAADNNISWLSFKDVKYSEAVEPAPTAPEITFDVENEAEVDLAETKSIHVSVAVPEGVEADADLYIEGILFGKDNTNLSVIGYTDFEDGVDVAISQLKPGNAYTIMVTKVAYGEVIGMDEETYMPIYENVFEAAEGESLAALDFAIKAEPQVAPEVTSITVNPNHQIVAISFAAEDAAPTYAASFALETAEGTAVNTTVSGEYGQNYGDMIYTFGAALEAGDYVLVLPAGSMTFTLDGAPFNEEIRVPFTIEGTEPEPVKDCALTASLFHEWDSYEANGNIVGNGGCDEHWGESNGLPYGNGSVIGSQYADVSDWACLKLTVTEGTPRILLNRQDMGGSSSDFIEISSADSPYVAGVVDGVWYIDIAKIVGEKGYAHINCIKGANWQNTTITEAMLLTEMPELPKPDAISSIATSNVKDGKFLQNGKVVIVKNGQKFNAAGARILK